MRETGQLEDFRKLSLLSRLTPHELDTLGQFVSTRACGRAEVIYHADKPGDECFLILKGRVKLCLGLEDGREISFEILGPGDFFGEGVLQEAPVYSCTAQTIEPTELLVIPRRPLLQLMEENGSFSLQVSRYMVSRLANFRLWQEMLLYSVNVRFARLLLVLVKRYGTTRNGPDEKLNVKLTHQEMANFIGTARETLTLTIGKFRNEGILAESGRTVVIRDMEELERRAYPISEVNYSD